MTSHKNQRQASGPRLQGGRKQPGTPRKESPERTWRHAGAVPYALGFLLLWIFAAWIYGPVFERAEQESFVSFNADQMKFLTDQAWGWLYLPARVGLLAFKSPLLGGLGLALIGTLTARLVDLLLRLPRQWRGTGFILPMAVMNFLVWRGLNLYYFCEPSIIVWLPLCALLAAALAWAIARLLRRRPEKQEKATPRQAHRGRLSQLAGCAVVLALGIQLYAYALTAGQNVRLESRMQLRCQDADWQGMIRDALAARHPSRTIAAYHAIALLQEGQLLERLFEIPYNYPDEKLHNVYNNDEGFNYIPDCNFYAGLINSAYRSCMEKTVQGGPSLFTLKRMAICAIMSGDKDLARKYLFIIGHTPFEQAFVDRYLPLVTDPSRIEADAELAAVRALKPIEQKFEQEYRPVAFMGYNVGVITGPDATLVTSVAAALYSKDLNNVAMRAAYLRSVHPLPAYVRQALAIAAFRRPELLAQYPEVDALTRSEVAAFLQAAIPFRGKPEEMAKALRKDWLGTYMYYYYCGNIAAPTTSDAPQEKGGIN